MDFQTYDASICIMTRMSRMMGGKWKPLILYLIQHGINRFGVLKKRLPKISKKMLTEQLRELEKDQLITRWVQEAKAPQVVVYSLTERGISLRKLIDEMIRWGMTNLTDEYSEDILESYSNHTLAERYTPHRAPVSE